MNPKKKKGDNSTPRKGTHTRAHTNQPSPGEMAALLLPPDCRSRLCGYRWRRPTGPRVDLGLLSIVGVMEHGLEGRYVCVCVWVCEKQ
jgi:hypothetical protein